MEHLVNPEVKDKQVNRQNALKEILKLCSLDPELAKLVRLHLMKIYNG